MSKQYKKWKPISSFRASGTSTIIPVRSYREDSTRTITRETLSIISSVASLNGPTTRSSNSTSTSTEPSSKRQKFDYTPLTTTINATDRVSNLPVPLLPPTSTIQGILRPSFYTRTDLSVNDSIPEYISIDIGRKVDIIIDKCVPSYAEALKYNKPPKHKYKPGYSCYTVKLIPVPNNYLSTVYHLFGHLA